jgi:hypothetical protein
MRAWIVLAAGSASLAIMAACAGSEDDTPPATVPPTTSVPDAGVSDADSWDVDVPDTRLPDCSSAGWCVTRFPDADLVFKDIWPFEDIAFAVGESRTEGVKALEWTKATNEWRYIDDQSQNGAGMGAFIGSVYAPNENVVYFTVGSSHVYRGERPVAPETQWRWTKHALPDNVIGHPSTHAHGTPFYVVTREKHVAFGVWGTDADNVYAFFSNTIFRRNPSDGTWEGLYVADDLESPDEHIFFMAAAGTGPNDLWFAGARDREWNNCPLLLHKSESGWERIVDGVLQDDGCKEREGTIRVGGELGGWFFEIQRSSANEYLLLHDESNLFGFNNTNLTKVRLTESGPSIELSPVPLKNAMGVARGTSLWRSGGENWITSLGLVVRGTDDGVYTPSSISRDGAPVNAPLLKIRGTSNQNLWAIGARYAYHKTTP